MKWTSRSLWWRGPLLRGLDRLHRWYILRYCPARHCSMCGKEQYLKPEVWE